MHRNAAEVLAHHLTFSSVNASADLNTKRLDRVGDCPATANGTRRTVKGRQKAVARRVDFSTAVPPELLTNQQMMMRKKILPCAVAELDYSPGRANDIREKYGCEHAVGIGFDVLARAGQKRFYLAEDRVCVPDPWIMIYSGELHILRPLDVPGQVS